MFDRVRRPLSGALSVELVSTCVTIVAVVATTPPAGATTDAPSILAWGSNGDGVFGVAAPPNSSPVEGQVTNNLPNGGWVQVVATRHAVAALRNDGHVYTWGTSCHGALGRGFSLTCAQPPGSVSITGVVALAAGEDHMLALKSDGTVWAWGDNSGGDLGNPAGADTPAQVLNLSDVIAIAAGGQSSYALTSDHTVWAWGDNFKGQLGNGSHDSSTHFEAPRVQ